MSTKEEVLKLLRKNNESFISGQEIADEIFVTRASVWKAIKSLEKEGYEIDAVTNKGYRLRGSIDLIDIESIKETLLKNEINTNLIYLEETTSTNDVAHELERKNHEDLIVVSDFQSKGRGRRGRDFFSPKGTGLYFSVLLHNKRNQIDTAGITAVTASIIAKAIDDIVFNGVNTAKIKWVNDIFINERKVAGILSEAFGTLEDEDEGHIIIGIGINIYVPKDDFPKELRKTAAAVLENLEEAPKDIRTKLLDRIITDFYSYFRNNNQKEKYFKIYEEKLFLVGNYVKINSFDGNYRYAMVTGISEDYHLQVQYDDGKEEELSSGEVSVVKY